jgi:hypothetical protein
VPFSAIPNPLAYASAGVTLTGDANGAQLTGLFAGGKAYEVSWFSVKWKRRLAG